MKRNIDSKGRGTRPMWVRRGLKVHARVGGWLAGVFGIGMVPLTAQPFLTGSPYTPVRPSSMPQNPLAYQARDRVPGPWDRSGEDGIFPPLQWGPLRGHPHFQYQFLRGNGFRGFAADDETVTIHTYTPGMAVELGRNWVVDYSAGFRQYDSDSFRDTVNHVASLRGVFSYSQWQFTASQLYSRTDDPLIETGAQTEVQSHNTSVQGSRPLGGRMSLSVGLSQSIRLPPRLSDSYTWSNNDWLNYQVSQPVGVGIGAGFGYTTMGASRLTGRPGVDMTFEQVNGRVTFAPTRKFSAQASVGLEFRQILSDDGQDQVNPIFEGQLGYQLAENTHLSANASRTVSAGFIGGETITYTMLSGGLRQRLMGTLYLDLGGGYRRTEYTTVLSSIVSPADRSDEGIFAQSRLGATIRKDFTLGIFYRYSENTSSVRAFGFDSHQWGLDAGVRF